MPFLVPILGLFGITAAVLGGKNLASNIPSHQNNTPDGTKPNMPWYVPMVLVGVGGVLLYKFGAKKLKV